MKRPLLKIVFVVHHFQRGTRGYKSCNNNVRMNTITSSRSNYEQGIARSKFKHQRRFSNIFIKICRELCREMNNFISPTSPLFLRHAWGWKKSVFCIKLYLFRYYYLEECWSLLINKFMFTQRLCQYQRRKKFPAPSRGKSFALIHKFSYDGLVLQEAVIYWQSFIHRYI